MISGNYTVGQLLLPARKRKTSSIKDVFCGMVLRWYQLELQVLTIADCSELTLVENEGQSFTRNSLGNPTIRK